MLNIFVPSKCTYSLKILLTGVVVPPKLMSYLAFYFFGTTQFLCTGVVAVLPTLVLFSMVINDLAKQITVSPMVKRRGNYKWRKCIVK